MYQHFTLKVLFESYMFRGCKIDASNYLLHNITTKLMTYGLNALTTLPQDSTEELLHWSLIKLGLLLYVCVRVVLELR